MGIFHKSNNIVNTAIIEKSFNVLPK